MTRVSGKFEFKSCSKPPQTEKGNSRVNCQRVNYGRLVNASGQSSGSLDSIVRPLSCLLPPYAFLPVRHVSAYACQWRRMWPFKSAAGPFQTV